MLVVHIFSFLFRIYENNGSDAAFSQDIMEISHLFDINSNVLNKVDNRHCRKIRQCNRFNQTKKANPEKKHDLNLRKSKYAKHTPLIISISL